MLNSQNKETQKKTTEEGEGGTKIDKWRKNVFRLRKRSVEDIRGNE